VSWLSKRQSTVALSSCEAEYIASTQAVKEAIWERNLLSEIDMGVEGVIIYSDNQGALKLLANPVYHFRTKHIDIQMHFVRESVDKGVVVFKFCRTTEQCADIMTKALTVGQHNVCLDGINLVERS